MFLELLKKYQQQYGIKIFAYCLLPDHLHLLVEMEKESVSEPSAISKSQEISDFMRDLNNNYTKYFNGRYERKGHLFRERFKSALAEKDRYLLKLTAYLHLNPEKLNLTADAKNYPYSSYQLYLYNDRAKQRDLEFLQKAINEALGFLGGGNYADYVRNVSEEERESIHRGLNRGGILGTPEFIKQVRQEVEAYQAQGLGQKYESGTRQSYKLFFVLGSFFLVLMTGIGGVYLFFMKRDLKEVKKESGKDEITKSNMTQTAKPLLKQRTDELKATEWSVRLIPNSGGLEDSDVLSFMAGKFVSAKLNSLGFSKSYYAEATEDNGRITWETVQTAQDATASWRGEIQDGKMRGMLNLRQKDKEPRDFSFVSTGYRRKD